MRSVVLTVFEMVHTQLLVMNKSDELVTTNKTRAILLDTCRLGLVSLVQLIEVDSICELKLLQTFDER